MTERTDWRTIPVYKENAQYAREHGELDIYRQSNRANEFCARAIDQMIRENFDGMRLNPRCIQPVIDTYGIDRMLFVLANTVQQKDYDGRFSPSNKQWAWTIPVNLARQAAEREKVSILGQLDKPAHQNANSQKKAKVKEESR